MPSSDQSADHGHEQTNGNKIEQAVANDNGGVRAGVALNSSIGVDSQAITDSFWQTLQQGLSQPQAALSANKQLLQDLGEILFGNSTLTPESTDRRFDDEAWRDNPIFRRLGQSYLAWGSALDKWLDEVDMEHMDRQRARYLIDVAKDIFAPVNTLPGNPVALRKARKTFGRSLVQGARNFYDDLKYNHGYPSAAKRGSFKIGTDVAASVGVEVPVSMFSFGIAPADCKYGIAVIEQLLKQAAVGSKVTQVVAIYLAENVKQGRAAHIVGFWLVLHKLKELVAKHNRAFAGCDVGADFEAAALGCGRIAMVVLEVVIKVSRTLDQRAPEGLARFA